MANTFLTPEVVAKEALMCLQSNLVMADLVHRDYSDEFVSVGDTVSIRKPAKFVAKNFTGQTSAQDITEGSVPVKLDRFRDITVAVDAKQLSLDIADFSAQVVEPAMQAIAQAIDEDLLAVGIAGAGYVREGTEDASDLADIADLAKKLDMNKAPMANRSLVMCPEHKYRYALTDNLSKVSYAGDSAALRDALLGKVYTLETYMDQNVPVTASSEPSDMETMRIDGVDGDNSITVCGGVKGSLHAGDGFIMDGYFYRFTTEPDVDYIEIDRPLLGSHSQKEVTLITGPMSLAFHRNGLALVTRKLALPMGAAKAAYASAGGLGVRVVYDYDAATKTDKVSFDIIYGIQTLDENLICALKG